MKRSPTLSEYQAMAEMRFLIRRYLNNTDRIASAVGIPSQQYMVLLQLRGLRPGQEPTVGKLAERMQLRPHSVGELVDRMEKRGLLQRKRAANDRRCVLLQVTPRGDRILDRIVRNRIAELRTTSKDLVRSLSLFLKNVSK